jgi:hypothetical protein
MDVCRHLAVTSRAGRVGLLQGRLVFQGQHVEDALHGFIVDTAQQRLPPE